MYRPVRTAAALALATLAAAGTTAAELEWSGVVQNGAGDVVGIERATDVAVSPDGRHVYVTGVASDSIAIFVREASTGALAYSDEVVWDAAAMPGAIPDLDQPFALALSADGSNLYAVGGSSFASRVVVFARDPASGALTYLQSLADGSAPGLGALDRPQDVLVSGDGTSVYVTAFEARAITALSRDPETGLLSPLQVIFDDQDGVDGLEGIQTLAESPDGAFVYVASASRPVTVPGVGGAATFARDPDGTLTFLEVEQQGVGNVEGLWAPRDVAVSPDGANAYVVAGGRPGDAVPKPGAIVTFARAADGTLVFQDSIPETAFGGGEPRAVAVSPDGASVYVVAYGVLSGITGLTPGKLTVFARDPESGALALAQRFDDGVGGVEGLAGALGVAVSPDGGNVYVAASQDPAGDPLRGSVAVFSRVPEPGEGAACAVALVALGTIARARRDLDRWRGRRGARPNRHYSASASSQSRGRRNSLVEPRLGRARLRPPVVAPGRERRHRGEDRLDAPAPRTAARSACRGRRPG